MAQAMPLHASAARLWLLSTLSCPVCCMWPHEVSDAVLCSPLWPCRSMVSFVFPSFRFHVNSRCMIFWGYRSFFIRFRCRKYRRRFFRILSIIPSLISSLLNISSFLILSLLVIPSIFRRHAISNTLSLCFCFSLIVHVSALYSRVHNTNTSYMYTCVFLWPCSVPWSSTPSPAPAKFPSPTKFSFPHLCQSLLVC